VLWFLPLVALGLWLGAGHTLVREGIFFSKAAMVTFGGAYAVLPYVSQQAVENYNWLTPSQMLDGLGLAETTPGPLIMVLQFVGFMGGWNHPGAMPPLLAANCERRESHSSASASSSVSSARIKERSMAWRSSRTLPGQL